jgi:acyl dehydratase
MYDDIVIGQRDELGSHTFTAESIIAFARNYDPQPFHLSEEEGRRSHFGALVAAGWQTGGLWMRMRVEHSKRIAAERAAKGLPPQWNGPSGGFKNLKRPLAARPDTGIIFSLNTGVNQNGDLVFSFEGTVFVPI